MFSLGTEFDLALAMASASVGLPVGSPPPVFAATSTDFTSFANSLPRRASMTAFLCLVVAPLLWPLMFRRLLHHRCVSSGRSDHRDEQVVPPPVGRQLRMERRRQHVPVAHRYRPTLTSMVHRREHLDRRSCLLDGRRADEHGMQRPRPG